MMVNVTIVLQYVYMFQRLRNYSDIYRHTEYPWSDTGRTAECTEWKEFETKCPNAQMFNTSVARPGRVFECSND